MGKLRFGIIGTGVGKTHAAAIRQLSGHAELAAVADVVKERAEELASANGALAFADHRDMLEKAQLDIVCVCTPSGLHGEQAMDVMRSGRHVIVEKPMATKLDVIEEMLETQHKHGVKLTVISQHRFDAATQRVKSLIDRGAFGKLALGDCQVKWWRTQDYYDRGGWRGTWEMDGGGSLMNQSIHSIDCLQWLMGPVVRVKSYMGALTHNIETEDTAVAVLQFQNGALGVVEGTTSAYPGFVTRIEVFGSRGSASIEDDKLRHLSVADEEQTEADGSDAGRLNGHAAQIYDMIQAVRENREPLVNGYEGRKGVAIIQAIYDAALSGRETDVRWT